MQRVYTGLIYARRKSKGLETELKNDMAGDDKGLKILQLEVMRAIQEIKSGKALGTDEPPIEGKFRINSVHR